MVKKDEQNSSITYVESEKVDLTLWDNGSSVPKLLWPKLDEN